MIGIDKKIIPWFLLGVTAIIIGSVIVGMVMKPGSIAAESIKESELTIDEVNRIFVFQDEEYINVICGIYLDTGDEICFWAKLSPKSYELISSTLRRSMPIMRIADGMVFKTPPTFSSALNDLSLGIEPDTRISLVYANEQPREINWFDQQKKYTGSLEHDVYFVLKMEDGIYDSKIFSYPEDISEFASGQEIDLGLVLTRPWVIGRLDDSILIRVPDRRRALEFGEYSDSYPYKLHFVETSKDSQGLEVTKTLDFTATHMPIGVFNNEIVIRDTETNTMFTHSVDANASWTIPQEWGDFERPLNASLTQARTNEDDAIIVTSNGIGIWNVDSGTEVVWIPHNEIIERASLLPLTSIFD